MVDGSKSKKKMKEVFLDLQMQLSPIKKSLICDFTITKFAAKYPQLSLRRHQNG